jgi:hypothetical protein
MNNSRLPNGSVAELSKRLNISKQAVCRRIRIGHEDTINLLEEILNEMIQKKEQNIKKVERLKKMASLNT